MIRVPVLALACLLAAGRAGAAPAESPPGVPEAPSGAVMRIEIASPHRLPERLLEPAIESLRGRPFSRLAVRESLDRLWTLGLLSRVEVEAVASPDGVHLRYRLERSPYLERLAWLGELGLPEVDLAGAAGLFLGGPADTAELERARGAVEALYAREGYRAATVAVDSRADPRTNGQQVAFSIEAGAPARIRPIEIRGAPAAGGQRLLRALGLEPGERYREGRVREGVRAVEARLRELGYFESTVRLREPVWDRAANTVAIELDIDEGPKTFVEVTGNPALRTAVLLPRLTFRDAGVVDEVEARASARQIENAYREIGHPFASATGALEDAGEDRLARFAVVEGPQVTVEAVEFSGNASEPAARLREQMQTRPPELLHRGWFVQETLDSDLRVLLRFYRGQGFPDAVVGPADLAYTADRTRVRITIPVAEGPRQHIGLVAIEGERAIAADEIRAAIPLRAGDPWDRVRADEARRLVERLYARRGYHGARVTVSAVERDGTVDVTYAIAEGELTRIGRILVGGLTATREAVVLRELPFQAGQPLDPRDLSEGRRRLAATRVFERADVGPSRSPSGPYTDVEISVREARPWRLDFGVGYETDDGARGYIEIANDNLFGTGRSATLRERVSERGDLTELTYREPWLLNTAWHGQLTAFRQFQKEVGFKFDSLGAAGTVERFLINWPADLLRGALTYSFREVRRFDLEPGLVQEGITSGTERLASVLTLLTWDRRDPQADPRGGGFHLALVETADSLLGSQSSFVKTQVQTSWFLPWPPPTLLALSARGGLAWPFGDSDSLPIQARFFAGGTTTVRGYTLNAIGPRDAEGTPLGGNAQLILNAEWRFPIWRWFGGAAFFDAGWIASTVREFALGAIFPGVGAGLRVSTPIGPIRLDVGYALRPVPGDNRLQFYLTIGHAF